MSYVPDATTKTEPQDSQKASTAALEFRTLKAYIADVLIPFINTKFGPSGGIMTGQIVSSNAVPLRVHNDAGKLEFYGSDGTTLTGLLQFNAGGLINLGVQSGGTGINLSSFGLQVRLDNEAFFSVTSVPLGKSGARWGAFYGTTANYSGAVSAASFTGDGSGLTGVPGTPLTGSAIVSALGYTPYPTSNPAGYQTSTGTVALASAATSAGFAAKAGTLSSGAAQDGQPMNFTYTAGPGSQPSWVWGANDTYNHRVWNPANFSVAYAATSGSALMAATAERISSRGSNGFGTRTVSTEDPSGGEDGDVWFKY
jgi:hypothetical protein